LIRELSQLSFRGTVTLHSGDARVELIGRDGRLEIHVPRGQSILKVLSLRKKGPGKRSLPFPSLLKGRIPVYVFGRPLIDLKMDPVRDKKVSWSITPLKFLTGKQGA